jgi:hypothetical protein
LAVQSGRRFSRRCQNQIDERLTIDSTVVLTIEGIGSFPGEVRWQNEDFAGIRFVEDAAVVEERLQRIFRTKEM